MDTRDSTDTRPHVVILGGGFGGLSAARRLADAPVRVTVVDRQNHHLFQPLLYQVATAALSPGDIASPIRWVLRRQTNARVLLAAADAVDPKRRLVRVTAEERQSDLEYDYLIVATGATHAYFGHDDWRESAAGLKTLADALRIRQRVLIAFERAERTTGPVVQRKLLTFEKVVRMDDFEFAKDKVLMSSERVIDADRADYWSGWSRHFAGQGRRALGDKLSEFGLTAAG